MLTYVCSSVENNACQAWVEQPDFVERAYQLISAFAITGNQAVMICTGFAAVHIIAYLLKDVRRSVN